MTDDPSHVNTGNLMLVLLSFVIELMGAVTEGICDLGERVRGGCFKLSGV